MGVARFDIAIGSAVENEDDDVRHRRRSRRASQSPSEQQCDRRRRWDDNIVGKNGRSVRKTFGSRHFDIFTSA